MSRSGYSDDCDWEYNNQAELYWNTVSNAIKGKRGQAFLREALEALDAMPVKRLIAHRLEQKGEVCLLGAVGRARGIDMSKMDPEDAKTVSKTFGIAECMSREIVFWNDETGANQTPEQRFSRMREWIERHIAKAPTP